MRLLLVTLEYALGTFSGNGVYALSSVRALRAAGHDVHVLCGAPPGAPAGAGAGGDADAWALPLPAWGRLDRHSAHEVFAAAAAAADVRAWAHAARPQLALGVDFTSLGAVRALSLSAPFVFLPWRVYSLSDAEHEPLEAAAAAAAVASIGLCAVDARFLTQRLRAPGPVAVVQPPLREDSRLAAAAATDAPQPAARTLLTCVVRLSPEKEPERFVALVEALAASGALRRTGVTPALCGAARDAYAQQLVARLRAVAPDALVVSDFLAPAELGRRIFARAALNFHPPLYDSFGMTVLEAAAWGAPSVMHAADGAQRGVGAAEALPPGARGLSFALDLAAPPAALAAAVEALLADAGALRAVADAAQRAALVHTEAANAEHTARVLAAVLADADAAAASCSSGGAP